MQSHLNALHQYRDQRRKSISAGVAELDSGQSADPTRHENGDRTSPTRARVGSLSRSESKFYRDEKAEKLRSHREKLVSSRDRTDCRGRLFVLLNIPNSSRSAWLFNAVMSTCVVVNIFVFLFNTTWRYMDLCPQRIRIIPTTYSTTKCNSTQEQMWKANPSTVPPSLCCIQQYDWGDWELAFTIIFSVELALRVFAEGSCCETFIIIDALAVLPFYLNLFIDDAGFFSLISSLRMLRLLKIVRHFEGTLIFMRAVSKSKQALIVPTIFSAIMALVFASLLYYIEQLGAGGDGGDALFASDASSHGVAAFASIPEAFWFMVTTFTTVGYGDVVPRSNTGRALVMACMVVGVLLMAMPLAIVGNNFVQVWEDREKVTAIEKLKSCLFEHNYRDTETVRQVFDAIDEDGSQTLSFQELRMGLQHMSVLHEFSNKRLTKIWLALDPDGNGEIEFADFQAVLFSEGDVGSCDDLYIVDETGTGDVEADRRADEQALALELSHPATRRDLKNAMEAHTKKFEDRMAILNGKLEALLS